MIALTDLAPRVDVHPAEYQRLLGYPRARVLEGRALELANEARAWYAQHGRPWIVAREAARLRVDGDVIAIDEATFTSPRLARTLRDAGADRVVLVAVSAGPELEAQAQQLWREEKPDEYFFHEVYGSAVVEQLVMTAGARLCAAAEPNGLAVLPHYSPGYPDWEIGEQARLHALLAPHLPTALEVLDSGMLRPKKALLAAFGVTPHVERVRPLTDLVPCEGCSLVGCQYRRAPYGRSRRPRTEVEAMLPAEELPMPNDEPVSTPAEPLDLAATYTVNAKALRRWVVERLTLDARDDGTTEARFRYEGTTCSNAGRALRFEYTVTLGPRDDRYPIVRQRCAPSPGDDGYTFMCRYRAAAPQLMAAIDDEAPLRGQPLDDVLAWPRPTMAAGCYCESESRRHKWGIVLETIHYALAQQEKRRRDG
ncbi:MAG: hypothetical protein JO180_06085 [Gemmatirosa sp.]|nr:hypothetical protein [Gemmatirosa sp.]